MSLIARRSIAALLSVALVTPTTISRVARAVDKQACADAYEKTQQLRKDGKLVAAREQALTCAQEGCPGFVRDECSQWADEIEKATPSIVFVVTDADGRALTDVTVKIDGEAVTDHLDGKPTPIDVGKHLVRFEAEGYSPSQREILVVEGERDRKFELQLSRPDADVTTTSDEAPPTEKVRAATPTATYVLGAIGVVGLAGFVAFGLAGNSRRKSLDDAACRPACDKSDVDAAKSDYLLADVSLGVSVVSLGLATLFYFTRGDEEKKPEPTESISHVGFDVAAVKGGGTASLRFQF